MTPALLFGEDINLGLEFGMWGNRTRLGDNLSSLYLRFVPRSKTPTPDRPARPSSSVLRNISTPVHTVLKVGRIPMISTSSPVLTIPRSTRPVTTVPRPEIVKDVADRHQERLLGIAFGQGQNGHGGHQIPDGLRVRRIGLLARGPSTPTADDRDAGAELICRQQLPQLQPDLAPRIVRIIHKVN